MIIIDSFEQATPKINKEAENEANKENIGVAELEVLIDLA